MVRASLVAVIVSAATLTFAAPALAAPCDGGMSSIEYALEQVTPGVPDFNPGAACSSDSECSTGENCEGGSCCVKKGGDCSGLGYCCGHPSQGCVNGKCPE